MKNKKIEKKYIIATVLLFISVLIIAFKSTDGRDR